VRFGELNRKHVVTESGRRLGRVHDVCGELRGSRLVITGLLVGPAGYAEHLGLRFGAGTRGRKSRRTANAIPWADVLRVAGEQIVVRDGIEL
jgi:sporulation protein YlmC with PRC-barrel domain